MTALRSALARTGEVGWYAAMSQLEAEQVKAQQHATHRGEKELSEANQEIAEQAAKARAAKEGAPRGAGV